MMFFVRIAMQTIKNPINGPECSERYAKVWEVMPPKSSSGLAIKHCFRAKDKRAQFSFGSVKVKLGQNPAVSKRSQFRLENREIDICFILVVMFSDKWQL